jgi:hypothetical protein
MAMLIEAGVPMEIIYRDELTRTEIKRRDPADLEMRARLLDQPAEAAAEIIHVASLRCLGWTIPDICKALVRAGQRNAAIHAVDTGLRLSAKALASAETILTALIQADAARRRDERAQGLSAAAEARSAKALAKRRQKLEMAQPLWVLPSGEISMEEISARVGLSVRSLQTHLGPRSEARAEAKRKNTNA